MAVMVEDMDRTFTCIELQQESLSLHVNEADLARFKDQDKRLAKKIGDIKLLYDVKNGLKSMPAYEELEEKCQISISTMKNTIALKIRPTRNFLYKFAIGLQLSLEEANELFLLCGGALSEDCKADFICMCAIRDKDDIYSFIKEFEEYTNIKIALRDRNPSADK